MSVQIPTQVRPTGIWSNQHFHVTRIASRVIFTLSIMLLAGVILSASPRPACAASQDDESAATNATGNPAPDRSDVQPAIPTTAGKAHEDVLPPPPVLRTVRSDAIVGEPYGAAELTIPLGIERTWQPDQPITVRAADDRLLFPCHAVRKSDEGDELLVRFLFRGRDPLTVDVESSKGDFVTRFAVKVDDDDAGHHLLLKTWWTNFTEQLVDGTSEELSEVGQSVTAILGRQLSLEIPSRRPRRGTRSSNLEKQFERSVSMLFGFESVRLAMMKDMSTVDAPEGPAQHALPRRIGLQSAPILLNVPANADVERLASHVPPECFYLRCRSLENYLWLRGLVMGWGGSLNEMVATPVVEHRVRERIERQLCLDPSLALTLELDSSIDDFALVGGDTYFAEGAAVGVLLLANNRVRVQAILDKMRQATAENGGANHRILTSSRGRRISLYATPDNAIRSFHVTSGDCHLVTNSRRLAERFLDCDQGKHLASLPEFQYARSKFPSTRNLTSFLYLSDPFFRSLTSPEMRIEASRRRRAAAELRLLSLARLICAAEGLKGDSISDLIQHQLLPPEFGKRADGSSPVLTSDGRTTDSLRGGIGTFLPIADVAVHVATGSEVLAYSEFTRQYLREWRAMDPVMVSLERKPTANPHDEQVNLEIMITPYARNAYEFLARYLAPSSGQRVKPPDEDVLALTARLSGQTTFDVCVGLRDVDVPFRIEKGSLVKEGDFKNRTFADWRSYAAVNPAGTSGLSLLGEFVKSLQSREIESSSLPDESTPRARSSIGKYVDMVNTVIYLPSQASRSAFDWSLQGLSLLRIQSDGNWTLMAHDGRLRHETLQDLGTEYVLPASQIQFRLRDVNEAKVGPYLHAVSWEAGRRLSGENAAWLARFAATTKLDLAETCDRVEQILGGELQCPLGGKYEFRDGPTPHFASSAWGHASRYEESAVPADYRLPFLAWMRGMALDFELSPTTLTSRVKLHVNPTVVRNIIGTDDGTRAQSEFKVAVATAERTHSYERLLAADQQLRRALNRFDPTGAWTAYLAVPPTEPRDDSDWRSLRLLIARFELVATDRKYDAVTNVLGFTDAHSQLKDFLTTQTTDAVK